MLTRTAKFALPLQAVINDSWETMVRVTFGLFMGGLVTLLALLYSGVPIVGTL